MPVDSEAEIAHRILPWFDRHARALPWRNPPGEPLPLDDPDWPYRVWLSEIMLQQTQVVTVKPYFAAFTARWPSVTALASADDADVMAAWAGLGYYARARNMLACARAVVADHGGRFPDSEAALLALPGVGAYTAAAIAAIAFDRRAVVIDGNVERVLARVHAVATPFPAGKADLRTLAERETPDDRPGDFAQAMMDLGATICTPRNPACALCPLADICKGRLAASNYPVKASKRASPDRTGIAWWIERDDAVLLLRRDAKRMLGGMLALPSDDWDHKLRLDWFRPDLAEERLLGRVDHVFTHFRLSLEVRSGTLKTGCVLPPEAQWWPKASLDAAGLPTLFAKAAQMAISGGDEDAG